MLFIMSLNFTELGIREIKDDPKRAQAARDLAKKCGCEIKQIYLTSGEYGYAFKMGGCVKVVLWFQQDGKFIVGFLMSGGRVAV